MRTPVMEGIGMDRDKQVGIVLARLVNALAQANVVITLANHDRAHARLLLDELGELARNGQHHGLFAGSASPHSAGVLTAVTGIDGNHQLAKWRFGNIERRFDRGGLAGRSSA